MTLKAQNNWLPQQRIDVSNLRAEQSAAANDWDAVLGTMLAGGTGLVVAGFSIETAGAVGRAASSLSMTTANSIIISPQATSSGGFLTVPVEQAAEVLNSSNAKVRGDWVAGGTNYVGIDLVREPASDTTVPTAFVDANTGEEFTQNVPSLAVLNYQIVISTVDFSALANVVPVAKVVLDANGLVTSITDCRPMLGSLIKGGSSPSVSDPYGWEQGRESSLTDFLSGDKGFGSIQSFFRAVLTRLFELGGGERWFSPTADRNVKLCNSNDVLTNGLNFKWTLGSATLEWKGIFLVFDNSTAVINDIADGTAVLADEQCLYVDVNRAVDGTVLTPQVADLSTLGQAGNGSRYILAWRIGDDIFFREYPYEITRGFDLPPPVMDANKFLSDGNGVPSWESIYEDQVNAVLVIDTFDANPTRLHEKGEIVNTPAFTATYSTGGVSGTPTAASLTDNQAGAVNKNVSSSPAAFFSDRTGLTKGTAGFATSSNSVVFTLSADDGRTPATKTNTHLWTRYLYCGTNAAESPTFNEAFIKGLDSTTGGSKQLVADIDNVSVSCNPAGTDLYVFIAFPAYMAALASVIDQGSNWQLFSDFTLVATVSVSCENTDSGASFLPENYSVYRLSYPQAAAINLLLN